MSGWFGTSNPEVDGPLQGIGAGYARRRNAQRRRYDPLGRAVIFEDPEANNQGETGPADPGEVARFNRKKAEQEMANTYMPAIMPRDFTVGGYTVRATFNPQLQNYIVSVLHGMGTMEKHTYSKNEGQAAINKHAQLASLAKKVAKYDTQTPKIVEKTNYNVALEVKTGGVARVYDQVMEFLGLGAVTPARGSTAAEVDTSILRRIEQRNGFQETPNQVPREITARTTVMDRKIITQPGYAPSLRGHSGTSINWKAMRQKSFRVVVIRKDRTEVFSSNWDGDYDKTVALYNSTVATVTNSPDFYDQDEPVVLPVTPANGGGGDITDPIPIDPGLLPTQPGPWSFMTDPTWNHMDGQTIDSWGPYTIQMSYHLKPTDLSTDTAVATVIGPTQGIIRFRQPKHRGLSAMKQAENWILTQPGMQALKDAHMAKVMEEQWKKTPWMEGLTDGMFEQMSEEERTYWITMTMDKWISEGKPMPGAVVAPIETTPIETTPIETTPIDTTPIETTPIDTPPESSENYNELTVDTREIVPGSGDSTGYTPQPLSTYQTETLEQNEWVIRQQAESNAVASQSTSNQMLLGVGLVALAGAMYIARE